MPTFRSKSKVNVTCPWCTFSIAFTILWYPMLVERRTPSATHKTFSAILNSKNVISCLHGCQCALFNCIYSEFVITVKNTRVFSFQRSKPAVLRFVFVTSKWFVLNRRIEIYKACINNVTEINWLTAFFLLLPLCYITFKSMSAHA